MRPPIPFVLRLASRLRSAATRATAGACYGAIVALTGFYGLLSWAVITTVTTTVAVACAIVGRE